MQIDTLCVPIMKKTGMYRQEIWSRACNLLDIPCHRAIAPAGEQNTPSQHRNFVERVQSRTTGIFDQLPVELCLQIGRQGGSLPPQARCTSLDREKAQ
jgi:hypothetical protein